MPERKAGEYDLPGSYDRAFDPIGWGAPITEKWVEERVLRREIKGARQSELDRQGIHPMSSTSEFDDFADDFLAEKTPRLIVIIGASKVEALLYDTLAAYFLPKRAKAKEQDELLEFDRPLGTFSSRIKMCYRLAIVDESLYLVLETLRSIRNESAHSIAFDTGDSPIREYISELRKRVEQRSSYKWTRERYFANPSLSRTEELQCLLLTICVLLEGIRKKTPRVRANRTSIAISKR